MCLPVSISDPRGGQHKTKTRTRPRYVQVDSSATSMEDVLALGADAYEATSDPDTFERLTSHFDVILNTVSAALDINGHLGMLDLGGTMINVGASPEPMSFSVFSLFGRSVSASSIGGIAETQEMLDFCAEHGIAAEVEVITADQVNQAWERVLASDVRFRFVIDISTLAPVA